MSTSVASRGWHLLFITSSCSPFLLLSPRVTSPPVRLGHTCIKCARPLSCARACVCVCVCVTAVNTHSACHGGGNGSWEIKALSCHNERLERWRDLSPAKRVGQDETDGAEWEKEGGEKKKHNGGSGGEKKWRWEALKHRLTVFSSMNSIRRATERCWQMLPPSSPSSASPSAIVKP